METKKIVIVLTNKGYVAIENHQIFDLWKNRSLKTIYKELHQRYPKYKIHLGNMNRIEFQHAVEVSNQYLTDHNKLESIKKQSINRKNYNKMKQLTFNAKTAMILAKISVGFTTQKLAGVLHITLQTGADVLQSGANTVAKGEAVVLTKLGLYNESKSELIKIRKEITTCYQELVKQSPKKLFEASGDIRNRIKDLVGGYDNKTVKG